MVPMGMEADTARQMSEQESSKVCEIMRGAGLNFAGLRKLLQDRLTQSKPQKSPGGNSSHGDDDSDIEEKPPARPIERLESELPPRRSKRLNGGGPPSDHDDDNYDSDPDDSDFSFGEYNSSSSMENESISSSDSESDIDNASCGAGRSPEETDEYEASGFKWNSFTNPFKILPFDGVDWTTYREDIRAVAQRQGVWDVLCGNQMVLDRLKTPRKFAEFMKREAMANELLVTSLDKSNNVAVCDLATVADKFKWLGRQYASRPFMNKLDCNARLIEYHFDPHCGTIHQYLINFAKKEHDLASMGRPLPEGEEREILLRNIRKYLNLSSHLPRDALEHMPLIDITATLQSEYEDKRETWDLDDVQEQVHFTKGVKQKPFGHFRSGKERPQSTKQPFVQKKKDISRVKCYNCGEFGHVQRYCPSGGGESQSSENNTSGAKAGNKRKVKFKEERQNKKVSLKPILKGKSTPWQTNIKKRSKHDVNYGGDVLFTEDLDEQGEQSEFILDNASHGNICNHLPSFTDFSNDETSVKWFDGKTCTQRCGVATLAFFDELKHENRQGSANLQF
ncbi:hypothetical protein AeNC1_012458 [Aphanomyces euteiches]|nr:hypothetical protein AeNC1_012458 [Aphanomyces euteiches]